MATTIVPVTENTQPKLIGIHILPNGDVEVRYDVYTDKNGLRRQGTVIYKGFASLPGAVQTTITTMITRAETLIDTDYAARLAAEQAGQPF